MNLSIRLCFFFFSFFSLSLHNTFYKTFFRGASILSFVLFVFNLKALKSYLKFFIFDNFIGYGM